MKSAFKPVSNAASRTALKIGADLDAVADKMFGPLGPPAYESYKNSTPAIWPPDAPDSFSGHPLSGRPIV